MIGYEPGMNRQRLIGLTVTLLATAFMALGLAACGSDDDGSGSAGQFFSGRRDPVWSQ